MINIDSATCYSANEAVISALYLRKNIKTAFFVGYFVSSVVATNTKILTVNSSEFYPRENLNLGAISTGGGVAQILIDTDGNISTSSPLSSGYWAIIGGYFCVKV